MTDELVRHQETPTTEKLNLADRESMTRLIDRVTSVIEDKTGIKLNQIKPDKPSRLFRDDEWSPAGNHTVALLKELIPGTIVSQVKWRIEVSRTRQAQQPFYAPEGLKDAVGGEIFSIIISGGRSISESGNYQTEHSEPNFSLRLTVVKDKHGKTVGGRIGIGSGNYGDNKPEQTRAYTAMALGNVDSSGHLIADNGLLIDGDGSQRIPRDRKRVREDQVLDKLVETQHPAYGTTPRPRFLRRVVDKLVREGVIANTAEKIRLQIEKYRQRLQEKEVEQILELALGSLPDKSRFDRTDLSELVLSNS